MFGGFGNIINQAQQIIGGGGQQQGQQQGQQYGGQMPPFQLNPNQLYKILSVADPSFCLDANGDPKYLYKLIIYKYKNNENQKWRIMSDGMGNYGFFNAQFQGTL